MSSRIPNAEEVMAAERYALAKMCISIPKAVNSQNLTRWDPVSNVCQITEVGCNPLDPSNPMTKPNIDRGGNEIDPTAGNPRLAPFWKYWTPTMLAYRSIDGTSPKTCTRANTLLYNWCENPRGRADHMVPGLTNAAPFQYTVQGGKEMCKIPKSYCDERGVSYNDKTQECYVKSDQKVAEFFASETAVRMNKRSSDRRLKDNVQLLKPNFMEGINVYLYDWNKEAAQLYGYIGSSIGFMADEVMKMHPQYVDTDDNGYLQVDITGRDDFGVKARLIYGLNNLLATK